MAATVDLRNCAIYGLGDGYVSGTAGRPSGNLAVAALPKAAVYPTSNSGRLVAQVRGQERRMKIGVLGTGSRRSWSPGRPIPSPWRQIGARGPRSIASPSASPNVAPPNPRTLASLAVRRPTGLLAD